MNTVFMLLLCIYLITVPGTAISQINISVHALGIWTIAGTRSSLRWIVIHNLAEAQSSGIYHIEVIQRARKAPVWNIKRVVPHMAITAAALQRSIIKPINNGAVYPEAFENALAQWQAEAHGTGGAICNTSVLECLGR